MGERANRGKHGGSVLQSAGAEISIFVATGQRFIRQSEKSY